MASAHHPHSRVVPRLPSLVKFSSGIPSRMSTAGRWLQSGTNHRLTLDSGRTGKRKRNARVKTRRSRRALVGSKRWWGKLNGRSSEHVTESRGPRTDECGPIAQRTISLAHASLPILRPPTQAATVHKTNLPTYHQPTWHGGTFRHLSPPFTLHHSTAQTNRLHGHRNNHQPPSNNQPSTTYIRHT